MRHRLPYTHVAYPVSCISGPAAFRPYQAPARATLAAATFTGVPLATAIALARRPQLPNGIRTGLRHYHGSSPRRLECELMTRAREDSVVRILDIGQSKDAIYAHDMAAQIAAELQAPFSRAHAPTAARPDFFAKRGLKENTAGTDLLASRLAASRPRAEHRPGIYPKRSARTRTAKR